MTVRLQIFGIALIALLACGASETTGPAAADRVAGRLAQEQAAPPTIVSEPGCGVIEVELSGRSGIHVTAPDPGVCDGSLSVPAPVDAEFERTDGGRVTLSLRLVNRTDEVLALPARLILPPDSALILDPPGLAQNGQHPIELANPAGTVGTGELQGAPYWEVGGDGLLEPGSTTQPVEVELSVHAGVRRFRLAFSAEAGVLDPEPPPIPAERNLPDLPVDSGFSASGDTAIVYYKNVLTVYFMEETDGLRIRQVLKKYGARIIGGLPNTGGYVIEIPTPGTLEELDVIEAALAHEPEVDIATKLTLRNPGIPYARYPSDGADADRDQWFNGDPLWSWRAIRAPAAWGCETGTYGANRVAIGVLDFHFNGDHPDLAPSLFQLVRPKATVADSRFGNSTFFIHGTAVAGAVSARGNNGIGIAGALWRSNLHLLAFGNGGLQQSAADPYDYMVEDLLPTLQLHGVRILVSSMNLPMQPSDSLRLQRLNRAVRRYLTAVDGVWVLAAGNQGIQLGIQQVAELRQGGAAFWAAAGSMFVEGFRDHVIFVTSTRPNNKFVQHHNFFGGGTEIAAPGVDVLTISDPARTGDESFPARGTSIAAPLVAGVAGQLLAMDPTLTAAELKDYLLRGARQPRWDSTTATLRPAEPVAGAPEEIFQLDAYGALSLLSKERPDTPICGLPVRLDEGDAERVIIERGESDAEFELVPIPNTDPSEFASEAFLNVSQGGRLLSVFSAEAPDSRVVLFDHRGAFRRELPGTTYRAFLEEDTVDVTRITHFDRPTEMRVTIRYGEAGRSPDTFDPFDGAVSGALDYTPNREIAFSPDGRWAIIQGTYEFPGPVDCNSRRERITHLVRIPQLERTQVHRISVDPCDPNPPTCDDCYLGDGLTPVWDRTSRWATLAFLKEDRVFVPPDGGMIGSPLPGFANQASSPDDRETVGGGTELVTVHLDGSTERAVAEGVWLNDLRYTGDNTALIGHEQGVLSGTCQFFGRQPGHPYARGATAAPERENACSIRHDDLLQPNAAPVAAAGSR